MCNFIHLLLKVFMHYSQYYCFLRQLFLSIFPNLFLPAQKGAVALSYLSGAAPSIYTNNKQTLPVTFTPLTLHCFNLFYIKFISSDQMCKVAFAIRTLFMIFYSRKNLFTLLAHCYRRNYI